jgi:transcriptional regulator with XRE-family HTH domain
MANKRPLHQHLYTCLGEIITLRRRRLGLSQEALAADSGVDRAFISDLERGKRNPSFGVVASIADGLKMRYSRLVHRCEECALNREEGKSS